VRVDLAGEPPRGFLSAALVERLLSIVEGDIQARAVVVEGRDGTFCMGLDPNLLIADGDATPAGERARVALQRFDRLLRAFECASCPVIAVVDGAAAGGGVALAAAADRVIATRRASFGLPETLLGIVPALAFPILARRIGTPRARWMSLSGVTIDAAEALRLGIIDVVADEPEAALARCLRRLARLDARSIAAVKRLATLHRTDREAYESVALQTFGQLLESPETQARLCRFAAGLAPWPEDETA
jgi:enoyl-CoA hydratase/carnithine racemase